MCYLRREIQDRSQIGQQRCLETANAVCKVTMNRHRPVSSDPLILSLTVKLVLMVLKRQRRTPSHCRRYKVQIRNAVAANPQHTSSKVVQIQEL